MRAFNGRWISGSLGSIRIAELTSRLHGQIVDYNSPETQEYQPWMSCSERLPFFKAFALDLLPASNQKPDIVTEDLRLNILHRAFFESAENPFGLVDGSLRGMMIASPGDTCAEEFETEIRKSLNLIVKSSPTFSTRLSSLAIQIIPLAPSRNGIHLREMGSGLSTHFYKGGIFISLPRDFAGRTIELAINLVHELAHQALMVYQNADQIMITSYDKPVYSPVRKTHRPAILSFHAVIALSYMAEFLRYVLGLELPATDSAYALNRLSEISSDLDLGVTSMNQIQFTEFGCSLLKEVMELSEWIKKPF